MLKDNKLVVNEDKTEHTVIKRGRKEKETWRGVIKLGDREDTKRRKEMSSIAMKNNEDVWKNKWRTSIKTRLRLYDTQVKSILLYNYGTWG